MFGSKSYGTVSILVDGEEKFSTGRLDSSVKWDFPFNVSIDGADSMVIVTDTVVNNGKFIYGLVEMKDGK